MDIRFVIGLCILVSCVTVVVYDAFVMFVLACGKLFNLCDGDLEKTIKCFFVSSEDIVKGRCEKDVKYNYMYASGYVHGMYSRACNVTKALWTGNKKHIE